MCWKSSILTERDIENIKDDSTLTKFKINKKECSLIELLADDFEVTSSIKVNITGTGLRCSSAHPVILPMEVTTATRINGEQKECPLTATITGNTIYTLQLAVKIWTSLFSEYSLKQGITQAETWLPIYQ